MTESDGVDVGQILEGMRREAGPEMVPARREAEAAARSLLDGTAGRMSAEQAHELAQLLNRHWWGTGVRFNRFLPGLSKPLVDKMVSDIDHFNQVTFELWRGEIDDALDVAGRLFKDPNHLPGSGRSYPTMLLYLREPDRFAIWFKRLDRGLTIATGYAGHGRTTGLSAYLDYCEYAQSLRSEYGVAAEELDALLVLIDDASTRARSAERKLAAIPTIPRTAIEFLADLAENNDKEWLDANRERYEQDLRDPLAEVFEYVAANYLRSLDPKLQTEVKRDVVLARLNKWSTGVPYYEYLWGAFSRGRKQEDVQLFISVHTTALRYGVYFGSAQPDARTRLRDRADDIARLLPRLEEAHPELRWERQSDDDAIEVRSADEVLQWAGGSEPTVAIQLDIDDPLIGSEDLADQVGRVHSDLHALASIAWGDDVDISDEPIDATESARPEYTFEDLVTDTNLDPEKLEEWAELLSGQKRAALFYGPPGTGKTFVAERLGRYLAGTEGEVRTVQFHPSFSYEDFIEGLRPTTSTGGSLSYEVRGGVFKAFCDEARGKDAPYVFVIDEINRAELGSVLGEVMMLIEYRGKTVPLPYSQQPFSIPRNIVLLATMNTADRSLALIDFALRRRFHAFSMPPDRSVLERSLGQDGATALQVFDIIHEFVDDADFAPGHSYWMTDDLTTDGLLRVWNYEIRPYLEEYWFESRTRLDELEKEVLGVLADGA